MVSLLNSVIRVQAQRHIIVEEHTSLRGNRVAEAVTSPTRI
jgi:hypothetical protein